MTTKDQFHTVADTRHRPDVDGLRAIAILSVLGFHAFNRLLPGGFVGVDIFFVISGYLISGILLRGLAQNTFSFANFYSRRVKRIFPALALVLVATYLAGWYLLLPDEFARVGKEIVAGAGFVANISYWRESGYFDQASELKPLLHLWSLGVEEQFYLIWPLLLFVAWKRKINLLWMTLGILLASFVLNVVRVHAHEAATFYLLPSRLWELALGGAYACWEAGRTAGPRPLTPLWPSGRVGSEGRVACQVLAGLGLLLLLFSVVYLKSSLVFPGWWALPPTLGSIMLIAAGPSAWVNRNVLASRPMVFIGLISYPLYLWHWPLLSLDYIVAPATATPAVRIVLLLIAGVLAWLTYEFVERPIRSNRSPAYVAFPLAGVVAAIGTVGFLALEGAAMPRSGNYGLEKIIEAANGIAFPGPHLHEFGSGEIPLRRQGTNARTALFMGDSFIEQYYPRLDWLLQTDPKGTESVAFATSGGCPPIPNVRENHHLSCVGLFDRAEQFAEDPNVNVIVIGANWVGYFLAMDPRYSYYFDDGHDPEKMLLGSPGAEMALAELQSMITRFKKEGKDVYLVLQSPNDDRLNPRALIGSRWGSASFRINLPIIRKDTLTQSMQPIVARLRRIAALTGARVIDPVDYLCGTYCPVMTRDGLPIYRDEGHLNPRYVRANVRYFDSVVMRAGAASP